MGWRRLALTLALLFILLACGCKAEAQEPPWWFHGIAVTETGGPVGGGAVTLWRASGNEWVLVATRTSASQAWGVSVRQTPGTYRIEYSPPKGWVCLWAESAGTGWQIAPRCEAKIVLPEHGPSLGPDLVFVVGPAPTSQPTLTRTPMTATPTVPVPPKVPTGAVPTIDPNTRPTMTPSPTPVNFVPPRFQQFSLAEQESIIATAYSHAWKLETDLGLRRYDDQTMILGTRWLNGPPMTRAFEVTDAEGYVIRCRGFVWGIVAMHEKRAGVYQFGVVDWDGGFMKEL